MNFFVNFEQYLRNLNIRILVLFDCLKYIIRFSLQIKYDILRYTYTLYLIFATNLPWITSSVVESTYNNKLDLLCALNRKGIENKRLTTKQQISLEYTYANHSE